MRILVTGTDGYLGCLLAPSLVRRGHDVAGLDTGFYRTGWLYDGVDTTVATTHKDIRDIERADLEGFDAIVHMAELSNDPVGALSPTITYEINHQASVRLAKLAKEAGIERFVYMSSCSVYGVATGSDVTETSPVNPQTAYGECKVLVERDLVGARRRHVLADLPAQRDRVRRVAADAVRHRVEQPGRARVDDEPDRDGQRRNAVATARARARHRAGDRVRARGAA